MNVIVIEEKHLRGKRPEFVVPDGCWIAGGAIRAWFSGKESSNDTDVFGRNEDCLNRFVAENNLDISTKQSKPRLDTYMHNGKPVQIIKFFAETVDELMSKFDYTVCQFAWDGSSRIFSTIDAVISTERKHLGVNKFQEGFELDSLRRAFKYCEKGFRPCVGTITEIAKQLGFSEEKAKVQEVMSPGGGVRNFVMFD